MVKEQGGSGGGRGGLAREKETDYFLYSLLLPDQLSLVYLVL